MLCRQSTTSSAFVDWWLQLVRATQLLCSWPEPLNCSAVGQSHSTALQLACSRRQHAETLAKQAGAAPFAMLRKCLQIACPGCVHCLSSRPVEWQPEA